MIPSIRRSRAAELAVLYEISSFEFSDDKNRIAREALEMATRLFGARYFALLKGMGAEAYTLATFGFKDARDLTRKLEERVDNQFFSSLGNLGSIFLEQSHKVDTWERHLYMIFARQIEKALLNAKNTTERKLAEEASKRAQEELQKRLGELEIYYRATIGRESRIIELKHQVNELLERLGEKKKYGSSG